MAEPRFLNINKYIQHIRKTYKRINLIQKGNLYTYTYLFNHAPNFDKQDYEKIKFYDYMPVTFIFDIDEKNKTFTGINFHHLPVASRLIWLNRLKKMRGKLFEQEGVNRVILRYGVLKFLMKKSIFGIRKYRMDRTRELRIVPNQQWEELLSIYSRTYFGVTLAQVEQKYKTFIPGF